MPSAIAIVWNTMVLLGSCSLLLLLSTYYFVKTLPQRKNLILVNLVLTSYFSSIPPLLLLFTGQLERIRIQWICTLQAASMDSVIPMFSLAMVALAVQVWSDMRAHTRGTTCILERFVYLKWMLIFAPYLIFLVLFAASLKNMLLPLANIGLHAFVFCTNDPLYGYDYFRALSGYIIAICMGIAILLEVWIAISVYGFLRRCRVARDLSHESSIYRSNLHMSMRLFIFSLIQLCPILLTVLHGWHTDGLKIRNATQVLGSMYTLSTFFVFGTQRTVLQAWKILPPTAQVEKSDLA